MIEEVDGRKKYKLKIGNDWHLIPSIRILFLDSTASIYAVSHSVASFH